MAGPKPDDSYNSVPQVAPRTDMPGDYLQSKASPAAFGAEVGQATEKVGGALQQIGDKTTSYALQQQGLLNEHAATAAEMQLAVQGGQLYDKYKSMTGFDAVNSKDKAVEDYMAISNKIRDSLGNPAAQRAYDSLATRRMSYTIQDMNSYAATEEKKAYVTGKTASMNLDIDSMSRPEVASNQGQVGYTLGSIKFKAYDLFTNPQYGAYKTLPYTVDGKGDVKFDQTTDQGKLAQADMENYINVSTGKAFKNATDTLASQNTIKAHEFVEANRSNMSNATYAELSHKLAPAVEDEKVRSLVDDNFNQFTAEYQINPTIVTPDSVRSIIPGSTVTSMKRSPEENAKLPGAAENSLHLSGQAADFIPPAGMTIDQAKAAFQAKGYNVVEATDQKDTPEGEKAHFHIAWSGNTSNPSDYTSYANALGIHSSELIEKAKKSAEDAGLDLKAQDAAGARMETKINQVQHNEALINRANEDGIVRDIYDGKFPSQEALDKDPRFQTLNSRNSILAGNITTRILPAMARGMQSGYGTEFYKHLLSTLSGNENPTTLSNYVGQNKDSPITNNGYKILGGMTGKTSTTDVAFNKAFTDYLVKKHGEYTGSGQFPGSFSPTETNDSWNHALMEIIPRVNAGRAAGMTADQMFNPESKDYIQPGVKTPTIRQIQETMFARRINQHKDNTLNFASLDELKSKIGTGQGKISYADALKYGRQKGWIAEEAPSVPRPQ